MRGWIAVASIATASTCSHDRGGQPGDVTAASGEQSPPAAEGVLVGAGEIAGCTEEAEGTAALLETVPEATVATFGGHAGEPATRDFYTSCYESTWGRERARTRPAVGTLDLAADDGRAYYEYFGESAGPAGDGWYSYDIGSWHIVVLNSDCDQVGCKEDSDQVAWLRDDLSATCAVCIGAYWEKPRFSSGSHGNTDSVQEFWTVLNDHGAEFVLNGYDAGYERFGPQDAVGAFDPEGGVREFVVGTGGAPLSAFESVQPNSEVRDATAWGVIKFMLLDGSYSWEFVVAGRDAPTDRGNARCSGAPPGASPSTETVAAMAGSEDDAEEHRGGKVSVSSSDLEMIMDGEEEQTVGLRFPSVEIPEGAELLEVYVQFVAATPSVGEATFRIAAADVDAVGAPFTARKGDLSERSTSVAFVTWLPEDWAVAGAVGPAQRTPDLRSVFAEIRDAPSWRDGDAVVLLLTGSGLRVAQSFDRAPNRAPVLHVVFDEA